MLNASSVARYLKSQGFRTVPDYVYYNRGGIRVSGSILGSVTVWSSESKHVPNLAECLSAKYVVKVDGELINVTAKAEA